ncbi:acid protease [Microstroma glucosiphilum]|uniref:Acid protease n=1 Tax=Pseudomicrostroma glucosiphilum TaxID=1684307 RepID=A0A316U6W7_9BASI|nr:acid protease [Pseudomicrostroma glucosiphilum]PWN20932.1 acid protease [Pseudomicrostroma glucosiphilum]
MLSNVSSSPFRSLLLFLVVSIQLTLAASVAQGEPTAIEERADNGFSLSLKRNNLWDRSDRTPLENLEAQTKHMKSKYRQNFLAYHNNTGHCSPQMNSSISIASLEARAFEEDVERSMHRRSSDKHGRSRLDARAGSKATVDLKATSGYVLWQGSLSVGTPAQSIKVTFDTGSADFVTNLGQYSAKKSSTSKNTGNKFSVYYADGTGETGYVYNETVTVGKSVAKKQAVGIPTWSSFDSSEPGLVGMAFESISQMKRRPLVQNLFAQGAIPKAMFGVALSRDSGEAEMQLGGYHRAMIASGSSLKWNSVDNSGGFWVLDDVDVKMSRTLSGKTSTGSVTGRSAIMDTGTTLIYGPTADVKALYEGANVTTVTHGSSVYGYYSKTPNVTFSVGGVDYAIKDAAVSYTTASNGFKYGSIIGTDDLGLADGQWLIGDPWFSSVYSVFDITNTQMGLAAASY